MTDNSSGLGAGWIVAMVLAGLLAVGGIGYTLVPLIGGMIGNEELRTEGVEAQAEILSATQTRTRFNEDWVFEVELQVLPEGAEPFWGEVSQPFSLLHIPNLRRGGAVTVRYDAEDRRRILIVSTGGTLPDPAAAPAPALPNVANPPTPPPTAPAGPVDPVCAATTQCCLRAMGANARRSCEAFSSGEVPATVCATALGSYQAAAKKRGRPCR